MVGGNRGLWLLRIPLEHLGARVFPDMFSLATARQALSPDGEIVNPTSSGRFVHNVVAFMSLVEAAKHYPCIKKAVDLHPPKAQVLWGDAGALYGSQ